VVAGWRSVNSVGQFNEVKLRRVRSVLGLVTTSGGSTIKLFSRPIQRGRPSVCRCNEEATANSV